MAQVVEQTASIFELMIALLSGHRVEPFAGLPLQVVRYPPELEKAFGVRYGYGTYMGDMMVPFG